MLFACFGSYASISIHSLRMEGDMVNLLGASGSLYISIHSLRMEGDCGKHSS